MQAGDQLGNYVIKDRLGRGATAEVFRALQPTVERDVAVKVMFAHLTDSADFAERFQREARAMGKVQHPNIARIIDFDANAERPYMVMEYLGGGTLHEALQRTDGPMDSETALRITRQLADALRYAHDMGLVHRDIKPGNVLFTDDSLGCAMLTDFGMARLIDDGMTATGTMLGTPAFMAPEQIRGESVSGQSDIYSLGVMLFGMVTGTPPYEGDSVHSLMMKHADDPIPAPSDRAEGLDPELDALIQQMLAKKPEDRPADAGEVVAAIDRISGEASAAPRVAARSAATTPTAGAAETTGARSRVGLLAAAAAVALIALGTVFALTRGGGSDGDDVAADTIELDVTATDSDEAASADAEADGSAGLDSDANLDFDAAASGATEPDATEPDTAVETEERAALVFDPTEADRAARAAFDPADPPAIFLTSAQIAGEEFVLSWDRTRPAPEGTEYQLFVDDAAEPLGALDVDSEGRGTLTAVAQIDQAQSIAIRAVGPTADEATTVFEHSMSGDERFAFNVQLGAHDDISREMAIVVDHTSFIADAITDGDLAEARRHTEHVINIIDGLLGPLYGDLDGNGLTENPGDGTGVLEYSLDASPTGDGRVGRAEQGLTDAQDFGVQLLSSDSVDEAAAALAVIEPLVSAAATELALAQSELQGLALRALIGPTLALTGTDTSVGSIALTSDLQPLISTTLPSATDQVAATLNGETLGVSATGLVMGGPVNAPTQLGEVVLAGPGGVPAGIGQLSDQTLATWTEIATPDSGIIALLDGQAQIVADHADLMQREVDADNHSEVRRHAEHLVNIIVGEGDELFGDLDGDGAEQNPGDGVGVLTYLSEIEAELDLLPTETIEQRFHNQQFFEAVAQIREEIQFVQADALRALATDTAAEAAPLAESALTAAVAALDGFDIDESGHIDNDETGIRSLTQLALTLLTAPLEP